jgi:hypothetical protein
VSDGTELDQLLQSYKAGDTPRLEMVSKLVALPIILPSASEIDDAGAGYQPLVFDRMGTDMVAAFSNEALAQKYADSHPHLNSITAGAFIELLKPEVGLVLNPHEDTSLEMVPDFLNKLRAALRPG